MCYFSKDYEKTKRDYMDLQKSMKDMDAHYKEELTKAHNECKSLQTKYADLKQRMATKISIDLESSGVGFEDLSDPCNESRLREMYDSMRIKDWPKLKRRFANMDEKERQQFYDNHVQTWKRLFDMANNDVQHSKEDLKKLFLPDQQQANKGKILQNLTAATHSLQVAFSLRSDTYYQDIVRPLIGDGCPEEERMMIIELAASFFKLMCLMLLHNPPMTPDWRETERPDLWTEERMFPPIIVVMKLVNDEDWSNPGDQ